MANRDVTRTPAFHLEATATEENREVLLDYVVGMISAIIDHGNALDLEVLPDPLNDLWGQFDWDVPRERIEQQARSILDDLTEDELNALLSLALSTALNFLVNTNKVDFYLAASNMMVRILMSTD